MITVIKIALSIAFLDLARNVGLDFTMRGMMEKLSLIRIESDPLRIAYLHD